MLAVRQIPPADAIDDFLWFVLRVVALHYILVVIASLDKFRSGLRRTGGLERRCQEVEDEKQPMGIEI